MSFRRFVQPLGMASVAVLAAACGSKAPSGKCTPSSASGFTGASKSGVSLPGGDESALSLNVTSTASLSSAKSPRMPGGLLRMDTLASGTAAPESVSRAAFASLAFTKSRDCSAAFEFRKDGDAYVVDAFLSHSCLYPKLVYRGRNPVLQVFRPASDGFHDGYDTLAVTLPELDARNATLTALDAIPQVAFEQRSLFVEYGIGVERMVRFREVAAAKEKTGLEPGLGAALCLAVPQSEIDAYDAAPADARGIHPTRTTQVRPDDCQILANSQWHTFKVPAAEASAKKALLDALVAETAAYKAFVKERSGLAADVMAKLDDLRTKSDAWYAAERRFRTLRLGMFSVRAANGGCPSSNPATLAENKVFSGTNRAAYMDLVKTLVPSDVVADIEALKAHACGNTEPAFTAYAAKVTAAGNDALEKAFAAAKASREVQIAMKAQKDRVGIATNHILNHSADSVVVTFKDLAVFPATGGLAAELARHAFAFDKDWVGMSYDATKAHPLVNNLRSELNDGYALTFGGVPVGAVIAKVDESGGASVIALPKRSRADAGKSDGSAAQAPAPSSNKRETTTTSGEGC